MLPVLILLAFAARVAAGLFRGPDFFEQGYGFYTDIAASMLRGDGFCYAPGEGCAIRMPLYPALVAALLRLGFVFPGLVILQSALGAAQVWLTWRLGRDLFNARTGLLAAALTAINPYGVVHDSAFQDTAVFNTLVLAGVVLVLEGARRRSLMAALAAGGALGFAVLTNGRIALLLPCAIGWLLLTGDSYRWRQAAAMAAVLSILVGGWVVRNWRITGAPVLSTESGLSLWVANNATTLDFYPRRSIDLNTRHAWARLTPEERRALDGASELERDRRFARLAAEYVRQQPARALVAALRKMAAGLSGQLSPAREGVAQWAFAAIFVPIHVMAAVGWWRARPWTGGHLWSLLVIAAFAATTAIFWAHTSHASYLQPLLFTYAAAALASAFAHGASADRSLASPGRVASGHS